MPVIAAMNTKGGSGKSTTIAVLADRIARGGGTTVILDADPDQRLMQWKSERIGDNTPVVVVPAADQATIIDIIDEYAERNQFVFVDLQGARSLLLARASSRVNLALLPISPSGVDAVGAMEAAEFLRAEERALRRSIPVCVTFNRIRDIPSEIERELRNDVRRAEMPMLEVGLYDRKGFNNFIGKGHSLEQQRDYQQGAVNTERMQRVIDNADKFTKAFVGHLRDSVLQHRTDAQ